jgi:hypothetical protein
VSEVVSKIEELCQEIEQLHRETMDRLNRMAWQVEDILTALELVKVEPEPASGLSIG